MIHALRLALIALALSWASSALAKCYPDASGGGQTCESLPANRTLTQTVTTLNAAQDATLGTAAGRTYLCLMNIGTGRISLGFDQAAVDGSGWALAAATAAGNQGGSQCWESGVVASNAVHAISAAGSTVVVLEGH